MTQKLQIKKATRTQKKIRMALIGPSGAGKTYSALSIARSIVGPQGRVLCIDSERGSAASYEEFDFDTIELESFSPNTYIEAIELAELNGYDALVIDSLSHAWMGKDGALELVDKAAKRSQSGNSFGAWRDVTPLHNQMIDAIVGARLHVIATMRAKTEYVQEKDPKTGRTAIRKVGLAPVQRDGMEYEFDVVGDLDADHNLVITKSRIAALTDQVIPLPGENVATVIKQWLQGAKSLEFDVASDDRRYIHECLTWIRDNEPQHPQKQELRDRYDELKKPQTPVSSPPDNDPYGEEEYAAAPVSEQLEAVS